MTSVARVIPWLVLAFALIALLLGYYEWTHPPFTDEQLRASLPDTFEVATSTTRVFGIVFLGLGGICLALARKLPAGPAQLVAYLAAAACALALSVFLHNQSVLADRVVDLTDHNPSPLFGLL
jgi:hypothetical protein